MTPVWANFTTLDLGTQGTDTTGVDTNTGTLEVYLSDGHIGGKDRVKTVVGLNKNTGLAY